jgi:hypothetical protein
MNNSHYYSKHKENAIYASTCVLGLSQLNTAEIGTNLLDPVSSNFTFSSLDSLMMLYISFATSKL